MDSFKYGVGDNFLVKDFVVKTETLKGNLFIQSKNYEKCIGVVTKRWIEDDDGCEYYHLTMEDGFELTVGKYFLNECRRVI